MSYQEVSSGPEAHLPPPAPVHTLHLMLEGFRTELIDRLSTNTVFLTYLSKGNLIDNRDIVKYERHKDPRKRNASLIDDLISRPEGPNHYNRFLEGLRKSNQHHLAAMMTNVDKELNLVGESLALVLGSLAVVRMLQEKDDQDKLEDHLNNVNKYMTSEERRAGLKSRAMESCQEPGSRSSLDKDLLADFLYKVHTTTKTTLLQFNRCKEVIEKLHKDCDEVARTNTDMLVKLRECDSMISEFGLDIGAEYDITSRPQTPIALSPRSKKTEADIVSTSMKNKLKHIKKELNVRNTESKACEMIIENILRDIEERKEALSKLTDPPPRDGRDRKYMESVGDNMKEGEKNSLRLKIEELAKHLTVYVHQETQLTHKTAVSHYSNAQSGLQHRNFDAIDSDMKQLHREIRRGDHQRSLEMIAQLTEATKGERKDCTLLVDDIERLIRERKHKIMSETSGNQQKRRTVWRAAKKRNISVESNFSKRLTGLGSELRSYIELETSRNEMLKTNLIQRKRDQAQGMKGKIQHIKDLEKRLRETEIERDKYKRMYGQEKAHILIKPMIPKRGFDGRKPNVPNVRAQRKNTLPDITKKERELSLKKLKEEIKKKERQQVAVKPLPRLEEGDNNRMVKNETFLSNNRRLTREEQTQKALKQANIEIIGANSRATGR